MDLKSTLKVLKMNEPLISTILGALVVLTVGILIVNYFKGRTPSSFVPPSVQTENKAPETQLPNMHTVQKGESLWKISESYYKSGYNWVDLAQANNLKNPDVLSEGMELSIPQVEAKMTTLAQDSQAPPSGQITKEAAQIEAIVGDTYKIQKGDSLWEVSVRAYSDGYQWTQVWEANKAEITNPNLIYPDQEIKLPR